MSDTLFLPPLPRHTLLRESERVARLQLAQPQIEVILKEETNAVALQAALVAMLWDVLPQLSWCGFYRQVAEKMLAVGPYQGPLSCLRIPFNRGVCGFTATTQQMQIVPDVHALPYHIACEAATRSELTLPIFDASHQFHAVLDLDSHSPAGFSMAEAGILEKMLSDLFSQPGIDWN